MNPKIKKLVDQLGIISRKQRRRTWRLFVRQVYQTPDSEIMKFAIPPLPRFKLLQDELFRVRHPDFFQKMELMKRQKTVVYNSGCGVL